MWNKIIKQLVKCIGEEPRPVANGYSKYSFSTEQLREKGLCFARIANQYYKDAKRAGGFITHSTENSWSAFILNLICPAGIESAKMLFDRYEFGWDEETSVVTGKYFRPDQNSLEDILSRREAALKLYHDMAADGDICLVGVDNLSCRLRFLVQPDVRRANYWGDAVWDFYDKYYSRHSGLGIHAFTKAFCRKLSREHGEYYLGGWTSV